MEDSSEVYSDGNRVSPEKNSKRILKTPAQLDALEKFYNEHKYPTEELKSRMAAKIGLTEKQISSWFCHRRLKDKKLRDETLANGRQDQANGIMQDCGSGLWQDSCGSIKQGDQRYTDEVNGIDNNTSSEGSLSLQERFYSPMQGPSGKETSGHLPQTYWSAKAMVHKPSGYLKVTGEIENAAVTAVKRQMGRHYREDGPLLSVEFEPLPPGAFEPQRRDLVIGSFYDKDLIQNQCPDVSGIRNESCMKNRHDRHTPKMSSQDSYLEETSSRLDHGSGYRGWKSHHHLKLNLNIHKHSYPDETIGNKNDVPAEQNLRYNNKKNYKINSKHSVEKDTIFEHQSLDHRTFSNRGIKPALYDDEHDVSDSKLPQSTDYACKPSSLLAAFGPSFVRNERAYILNRKENSISIEMETEEHEPARSKGHQTSELTIENKSRVRLPQDDYLTRSSLPNTFQRKSSHKRFSVGRRSSFSDVETMETRSSVE